jgi:hypothetical protein
MKYNIIRALYLLLFLLSQSYIFSNSVGDPDPEPNADRLPDPNPLVRGADPDPAPDPSIFS